MSARDLITEHLDLWAGAVGKKSSSGRGRNRKVELTGIRKLRELILELALSGRLVESEQTGESAHQLLYRIRAEKSRSVAEKTTKKPKKPTTGSSTEPYQLPQHWCWVRLGDVTNYGTTEKAEPKQVAHDTWVLELEDVEKESSRLLKKTRFAERQFKSSKNRFKRGDVLYGKLRPYLDKVLVADEPGVCSTEIIPIRGYLGISSEFLRLALKSPSFKRYAHDSTHGMNLPRLGTDKAKMALIPLAPEQEQHRIVQKVDELMALCDRLEQKASGQLEAHATLVDTLLGTLTQSETATALSYNWSRVAAHFDTLLTTERSIDKLKQTILQLAVMGRLVEQDEALGSSAQLMSYIDRRKSGLEKAGVIKKSKPQANICPEELPARIPKNWTVTRLGRIATQISDGAHHTPTYVSQGIPFLSVKDMSSGVLDFSDTRYISEEEHKELSRRCAPAKGDLLITKVGTTGIPVLVDVDIDFSIFVSVALVKFPTDLVNERFLCLLIASPWVRKQSEEGTEGVGNKNLVLKKIRNFVLPIPPLEEQTRIVQKVDELMALCDRLEERLNEASETRCQFAEATLANAISD